MDSITRVKTLIYMLAEVDSWRNLNAIYIPLACGKTERLEKRLVNFSISWFSTKCSFAKGIGDDADIKLEHSITRKLIRLCYRRVDDENVWGWNVSDKYRIGFELADYIVDSKVKKMKICIRIYDWNKLRNVS